MSTHRTHFVTTTDGVTIGGTVRGHGPVLVFLQGVFGDGDLDWQRVADQLADRYTCHLPSLRGRGLSGDHPDLSTSRIAEDFATYVDSVGQPAGVVGWSGGGYFALAVAALQPHAVAAVAPFEPGILTLMDGQEQARAGDSFVRMAEEAAAGDYPAALRAILHWVFNDHEIAAAEENGYVAAAAPYIPHVLRMLQQAMEGAPAGFEDPAVLSTVNAPMLLLQGSDTSPFFRDCVRYVVDHVPDARVREIPGAGHAAPLTHPEALAEALGEFFVH